VRYSSWNWNRDERDDDDGDTVIRASGRQGFAFPMSGRELEGSREISMRCDTPCAAHRADEGTVALWLGCDGFLSLSLDATCPPPGDAAYHPSSRGVRLGIRARVVYVPWRRFDSCCADPKGGRVPYRHVQVQVLYRYDTCISGFNWRLYLAVPSCCWTYIA
jgi:hypothetical protein